MIHEDPKDLHAVIEYDTVSNVASVNSFEHLMSSSKLSTPSRKSKWNENDATSFEQVMNQELTKANVFNHYRKIRNHPWMRNTKRQVQRA